MSSLTLAVSEDFKNQLKRFLWINWSEVSMEEAIKKLIFEDYLKTGSISDEAWAFCEKIDWHPVDELPLKEEFKKEIEKRRKEKSIKFKSVSEIFNN